MQNQQTLLVSFSKPVRFEMERLEVVSLLSVVGEFTARGVERERRNGDSGAPGEWPSAWAAPESPFRGYRRKEPPFLSNNTRQGDYPFGKGHRKTLKNADF